MKPSRRVLNITEVLRDYAKCSRPNLYRWVKKGQFPAPIRLGQRRIAWRFDDLENWLRTREVGHRAGLARQEVV